MRPPKGCEGRALELSTGGQEPRLPMPAHRENLIFNRNSSIKTKVEKKKKETVGRQDSTALAITAGVIYPITTTLNSPKQRHFCFLFDLKALGQQGPHTHACPTAGVTSMSPRITSCAPWKCPLEALLTVLTAEQTSSPETVGALRHQKC